MSKVDIKDRIKKALEIREITQSELAEKANIDKGQLSSYISGKYKPRQNNIDALATALNVNEAWLMGYDVPMERSTPEGFKKWVQRYNDIHDQYMLNKSEGALVGEYRKLNPKGQKRLLETAREMNCNPLYNDNYQVELAAAHKRTDIPESAEEAQADLDMMSDDNF